MPERRKDNFNSIMMKWIFFHRPGVGYSGVPDKYTRQVCHELMEEQ
jgi:hypothetical protein